MKFGLTDKTIAQIHGVFAHYPTVEKVIIYGSRAKGNYKNGSDIDLTLVGDNITDQDLSHIMREFDELPTPYSFDLSIFKQIDHADLIDHIKRIGIEFYKKSN